MKFRTDFELCHYPLRYYRLSIKFFQDEVRKSFFNILFSLCSAGVKFSLSSLFVREKVCASNYNLSIF